MDLQMEHQYAGHKDDLYVPNMCPMLTIGAIDFIRWARGIEDEEKNGEKDGNKNK